MSGKQHDHTKMCGGFGMALICGKLDRCTLCEWFDRCLAQKEINEKEGRPNRRITAEWADETF